MTGAKMRRDLLSLVKRNKLDVLLVVPQGQCSLEEKVVRKALNIWRTVPDRSITIPCPSSELSAIVIHKMLLTSAITGGHGSSSLDASWDSALSSVCRSLYLITRDQLDGKLLTLF
ncbi:hypothetical protein ANCCAN_27841 [Ancylostoma caninum]|uniref:Uncharacterized protein n=1 Tax=Ancylostoma caninum TaxID=29170 RepID=A0A368F2Z3_ANCCA|nr:hypothetical protein ANCCAN_27841 [Ancylostoma caninum]